jgi:DNA-binding NarL/FixJ family response regulator
MTDQFQIRILSVDDNPMLREGIAAIIESQRDMVLVSQAVNGVEAIQQYRTLKPHVTLMDLRLPDLNGIDAMIAIRTEFPDARIIMLTTFEDDVENQRALEAGASGYLLKSMPPNELLQAIRRVHAG